MSIKLLQKLDEADFGDLTPNEKLVLIALVTSAEKGGNFSWAGINLIRKRTNIYLPTTIRKAIRGLICKGYLERDKQEGKGKLRDGFIIIIPTKKIQNYHDFLEVEKEQNALREESKMLHNGGSKMLYINSKDRNSKKRNSKKLLSSTKEKENENLNSSIGKKMDKKKFKNPNGNVGKSVEEIVNQQMKEKLIPKKISPSYLWTVWNESCKNKNPKYISITLSGKLIGNLKYILKRIEGINPIDFIEVIINDWYGFGQKAKDQDAKSTSLHPSIPYFTQYLDSAVLFYGGKKGYKKPTQEGHKSPPIVESLVENMPYSEEDITEYTPSPKKGLESVSEKVYLTPEEQEKELDEFMEQVKKDKETYLKEKKSER